MSKQIVNVTIQVSEKELALLRETLRFSRERTKDPKSFILKHALDDSLSHANSTVDVCNWKHLNQFASKLGLEVPFNGV